MNVLFLSASDYPWRSGGVNQSLDNLSRFLGRSGHHVEVVAVGNYTDQPRPVYTPARDGVDVSALHAPLFRYRDVPAIGSLATALELARMPARAAKYVSAMPSGARPDVVVAEFTCALAAMRKGAAAGVPIVVLRWAHWAEEVSQSSRIFAALGSRWRRQERETLAMATCLMVDGPDLYDDALVGGVPRERVCLVPSAVDVQRFSAATVDPALLARYQLGGRSIVLFPSMLRDIKGFDHLIRAFAQLPEAVKARSSVVATGRGDQRQYARLARELGVSDRIVMLGEVSHAELPRWFAAAQVAVFPYLFGAGYSVAGIEAMAVGLPVVAYDVQAFSSLIRQNENGITVPVGDIEALSRAIESLLIDDRKRERIGHAARQDAGSFDISVIGAGFEQVLKRVMKGEPCGLR